MNRKSRRALLAGFGWLLVTACAESDVTTNTADSGSDAEPPMTCAPRQELPPCGWDEKMCEQAMNERTRTRLFRLEMATERDGVSKDAIKNNLQCVLAQLNEDGVEDSTQSLDELLVEATYAEMERTLKLEAVIRYGVECTDSLCEYCWDLERDECEADAFCFPLQASPLAEEEVCREEKTYVGCSATSVCGDLETYAGPPGGDCYWFSDTCTPRGWEDCTPQPESGDAGDTLTGAQWLDYSQPCD